MDEPAAKRKPIDSGEEAEPQDDGQQQLNTSPQPSVKRRKIGPISTDEERSSSISSIESEHSSHKSEPEEPPPSHLINQSNKVIWVDIGINPEETYWWPGLVYENNSRSYVALMPNSKSKVVDIKPKSLDSVKATMAFKAHSVFNPIEQNPILKNKELAQKYPTKKSLEKAYVIAREKTVIYSFEEDHDDLPDVSTCMIPLSQESRAVLANVFSPKREKSRATSPESEDLDDADSDLDDFDGPDQELEIPGETILCRSSAKSQDYWPARVISYTGLKLDKRSNRGGKLSKKSTRQKSEKTYQIQFCDGSLLVTPRSSFWTTDQEEFYTVKVGQVQTKEIKFEKMVPQIEKELHHLDQIINGKSSDSNLISKHESFLTSIKHRASIPQDVKYGKYSEELIHKVGDYLRDRYLSIQNNESESEPKITVDPRFAKLTETEKSQYIFDILVPELIWLITVTQYLEDGEEKLIAESNLESSTSNKQLDKDKDKDNSSVSQQNITITSEKILEEAKKLATLDIHEVDLVDKVHSLRADKKSHLSKKSLTTYNNKSSKSPESSESIKKTNHGHHSNPIPSSSSTSAKLLPLTCTRFQSRGNSKLRQTSNSRKTCTS
ncbi:hypothetical protein MJO28_009119 [Puccinia striiformis f. sp. tritici]|uniref:PWWP domain-containing protein n=2 Tax=Puccinia striiformis TaxID=27350 RepID=A0A2S4V339_9BASI|nr:hypothetical protein Pst134EB_018827 [Puccinia striiformis f. sp. tritici]KAI7947211.1 hypothetical protein MJO28_009119 [Puccinia striiformis f. sp. tritici]KAI9625774.1 hypothetical protein KEM48_010727 [Puccinia striiformis f. sp. tritici PST-130]POW03934.1 hypothetical protein PSTT_10769 [Puccinia striiformis]